jgi:dihydropteroate synthase
MNGHHTAFVFTFGKTAHDLASRTHIMGILNVTPDSFSDGGKFLDPEIAVEHGVAMAAEGADIIDIGGESTRPKSRAYGEGADAVSADVELERVIPVIERLKRETDVPLSIDTTKAAVAREALSRGAAIVNDVSGFRADPDMPSVVGSAGATAVIMHMKGNPKTMQADPHYTDLFGEISAYLEEGIRLGREAGIRQLIVDPGIGFGKTQEHNVRLIAGLSRFHALGCPVLVGASRKSFIGNISGLPPGQRLEGSLAAAVAAVLNGANILRVHDVRETVRAVRVADAIRQAAPAETAVPH